MFLCFLPCQDAEQGFGGPFWPVEGRKSWWTTGQAARFARRVAWSLKASQLLMRHRFRWKEASLSCWIRSCVSTTFDRFHRSFYISNVITCNYSSRVFFNIWWAPAMDCQRPARVQSLPFQRSGCNVWLSLVYWHSWHVWHSRQLHFYKSCVASTTCWTLTGSTDLRANFIVNFGDFSRHGLYFWNLWILLAFLWKYIDLWFSCRLAEPSFRLVYLAARGRYGNTIIAVQNLYSPESIWLWLCRWCPCVRCWARRDHKTRSLVDLVIRVEVFICIAAAACSCGFAMGSFLGLGSWQNHLQQVEFFCRCSTAKALRSRPHGREHSGRWRFLRVPHVKHGAQAILETWASLTPL